MVRRVSLSLLAPKAPFDLPGARKGFLSLSEGGCRRVAGAACGGQQRGWGHPVRIVKRVFLAFVSPLPPRVFTVKFWAMLFPSPPGKQDHRAVRETT